MANTSGRSDESANVTAEAKAKAALLEHCEGKHFDRLVYVSDSHTRILKFRKSNIRIIHVVALSLRNEHVPTQGEVTRCIRNTAAVSRISQQFR